MPALSDLEKSVLKFMSDGEYHSGGVLSDSLGVSRTMVWKAVKSLVSNHCMPIESKKGCGYRLGFRPDFLDERFLRQSLSPYLKKRGTHFFFCEELDSTNNQAFSLLRQNNSSSVIVTTEKQYSGRGRRGRIWQSPFGSGIYLSCGFRTRAGLAALQSYSLIVAVSLCGFLRQYFNRQFAVKWPNDIYYEGKKLAGILVEINGDPDDELLVVLGIGLNVSNHFLDPSLVGQEWTDLTRVAREPVDRNALLVSLVKDVMLPLMDVEPGKADLELMWPEYDFLYGKPVSVHLESRVFGGVARGVTRSGELRILMEDGSECLLNSGEVSVRPSAGGACG